MNLLLDRGAHPVIAHRGSAARAPENTLVAFDQALSSGADALEFDLRLTHDGQVIVMHDPDVARTTDGAGLVAQLSLAAIRELNAGARFTPDNGRSFPFRAAGVRVPLLQEVLERYERIPLLIETKVAEVLEPMWALLERHDALGRTVVDSSVDAAVVPLRARGLATGASMREVTRLLARACLPMLPSTLPYQALCIPLTYRGMKIPVAWLARRTRAAGIVTHVWTIDDPRIATRLWQAGVQGIITNDPAPMLRARAEAFRAPIR